MTRARGRSKVDQTGAPAEPPQMPEGISAFIARVLDQLSITAWFPAALLVAALSVLLQFREQRSVNFTQAIDGLTSDPVRVLVIIIPILIVATMITQAFSFQAIRILEGYNSRRGAFSYFIATSNARHLARKSTLGQEAKIALDVAFDGARKKMMRDGIPLKVIWALEAKQKKNDGPWLWMGDRARFKSIDWRSYALAAELARADRLAEQYRQYPADSRIMPTMLGNCLRAVEDRLRSDGDLEGFALRKRELASPRLRLHHDQFRNRLDMYCTLVVVNVFLAAITPMILLEDYLFWMEGIVISIGFLIIGYTSYLAAIQSAEGYGRSLIEMDKI